MHRSSQTLHHHFIIQYTIYARTYHWMSEALPTCVVQTPGICRGRHWWDGERRRPTVGLHQFTLMRHWRGCSSRSPVWLSSCRRGLGLCSSPQRRLEGGKAVELHPRQTPDETWGVVGLDEDWVYASSFCTETQS